MRVVVCALVVDTVFWWSVCCSWFKVWRVRSSSVDAMAEEPCWLWRLDYGGLLAFSVNGCVSYMFSFIQRP